MAAPAEKRKKLTIFYLIIVLLISLVLFLFWLLSWRFEEYTDDAYVEGNLVAITPLRPGFIRGIYTDETFLVKKGQLLIELDQTDSKIELEKARNDLAKVVREVSQAFHTVFSYAAEIEVRRAELIRSAQDFTHRKDVLSAQAVSLEDYQHSVAAIRASYFSYKQTESLFDQALAFVQGTSIKTHPVVLASADRLKDAVVQLYRCNIYSPVEGLAAQRTIQLGMWVDSGTPLLSVIPLDQIWVNANFKETQMKNMRIGQRVTIRSDLYGRDVIYHGRILGLSGAAGNVFSLLPPQNLSGNWIKIVQRLPARVGLDCEEIRVNPLRVGLSMEATVDLRDPGLLVPTSSAGSPVYKTNIFDEEEKGAAEMIERIIHENMDPTLSHYAETPLCMKKSELNPELKNMIPSE